MYVPDHAESVVPTGGHQNEGILPQHCGVNRFQLIEPELMKTEALVEDLHHLLRVGKAEASQAVVRRVSVSGLCKTQGIISQRGQIIIKLRW